MTEPQAPTQTEEPGQITVNLQYIKDFSFESPHAPAIFQNHKTAPNVNIGVNVQSRKLAEQTYEVLLMFKIETKVEDQVAFLAELSYGGVFTFPAVPEDQLDLMLFVHAPHLLFPFARSILSNIIQDGGFPQILINPIDFYALYLSQKQTNAAA